MRAIKVMLVEDEEDFRQPVSRFLTKTGMDVVGVGSAEEMNEALLHFMPDIIVLDVNLPGESGLDALLRLRTQTKTRLIMLTARGTDEDRIRGIVRGADSYLSKPVNLHELEAMIRMLWGRLQPVPDIAENTWTFDVERWLLISPQNQETQLSAAEYRVLYALVSTPGTPVSRDTLFEAMGRVSSGIDDRSLDVLLSRLRRKVEGSMFTLPIKSVRGIGYVFSEPVILQGQTLPPSNAGL